MPSDSGGGDASDGDASAVDFEELLAAFLAASGRPRRELFKQLRPQLKCRESVERIAVAVRDPSPKLSARVTSLLARHGLRDLFESQLPGLAPGKIDILERHYRRIADA